MADINFEDLSMPGWIMKNGIKTEKGVPFEFKKHYFLFDIARDFSPEIAVKKCAQVGLSVLSNIKSFFVASKMHATVIYTMPSDSDVEEFSKTKTDPIFQANAAIRSQLKLDNVSLKQIGDRFIYFKGTRSKTAPISTSADVLVHDEKDRSDLRIIEGYRSRISASDFKWVWSLSNPSQYKTGIDIDWSESDKKEWMITCRGCRRKQPLVWENNVDEVNKLYVCADCKKPLTPEEIMLGEWVATSSGRISGYHISQMMATWITPAELIREKEKRGIEYFRNFVLGEPYSPGEVSDFARIILDSWTNRALDGGELYMGIDVGRIKHWVLGNADGIFRIGKCERREELEEIIERYNPIVVMDSGPERTWAEEFRNKYPKLFICFYNKDRESAEMVRWGGMGESNAQGEYNKLGYVWIDRNRVIDDLVHNMQRGEVEYNLMRESLEPYIEHWQTMRRMEEVNALGQKRYKWETTTGVNHWASATWFYWVARQRKGEALKFIPETPTQEKKLIVASDKGHEMRNLEEVLEEMKMNE